MVFKMLDLCRSKPPSGDQNCNPLDLARRHKGVVGKCGGKNRIVAENYQYSNGSGIHDSHRQGMHIRRDDSLDEIRDSIHQVQQHFDELSTHIQSFEGRLEDQVESQGNQIIVQTKKLERMDEQIFSLKEEILSLMTHVDLQKTRFDMQNKVDLDAEKKKKKKERIMQMRIDRLESVVEELIRALNANNIPTGDPTVVGSPQIEGGPIPHNYAPGARVNSYEPGSSSPHSYHRPTLLTSPGNGPVGTRKDTASMKHSSPEMTHDFTRKDFSKKDPPLRTIRNVLSLPSPQFGTICSASPVDTVGSHLLDQEFEWQD